MKLKLPQWRVFIIEIDKGDKSIELSVECVGEYKLVHEYDKLNVQGLLDELAGDSE